MSNIPHSSRCVTCKETKLASEFGKNKTTKNGLYGQCKVCNKAYRKANKEKISERDKTYRLANKEKIAEKDRQWRAANAEAKREYDQRWRLLNVEREREQKRQWKAANRDRVRKTARLWYQKNRERVLECIRKSKAKNSEAVSVNKKQRRARLQGASGRFTVAEWRAKLESYKGKCHWCGKKIKGIPHADHLIPIVQGGVNDIGNIVPACAKCNLSKGGRLPHEWNGRLL